MTDIDRLRDELAQANLVNLRQIAEENGVSLDAARKARQRSRDRGEVFPEPVLKVPAAGDWYARAQVDDVVAALTARPPGRPPGSKTKKKKRTRDDDS